MLPKHAILHCYTFLFLDEEEDVDSIDLLPLDELFELDENDGKEFLNDMSRFG